MDKTPEQIFNEIKLDQLDEKIISDPEYNSLTNPTKNAIQLLLDLNKGKMEIYNKCYNKEGARPAARPASAVRPASVVRPAVGVARPASMRPRPISFKKPAPVPIAAPVEEKAVEEKKEEAVEPETEEEEEKKEEGQTGGRRRKSKGKKSKKAKRSGHKRRKTRKA